ncbi:actin-binding protein IPP-like [Mytilus californianus]|uniref:actin-binding protein IPP-like n=1 Tax=Mytilus californianus TaxID=6549 RepID=UPI002248393F|nr:actin-binding protein IPP-like [Mytilus californianus]XP_052085501.1 actin-binding protein IPP-like [Mytilus californianus]
MWYKETMEEEIGEKKETRDVRLEYEAYRKEFSKKLHQLRSDDEFCDIDIQVGSQTFRAHKIILAAGSSYFSAMFCSGMMEDHADVVTLYDIDPKIFSVLLDFIYLGEIDVTEENCQDLMFVADMIDLLPVVTACLTFLKDNIQPYNCIGIHKCADTPNLQELRLYAEDYIETNFNKVTKEEEFLELPSTEVMTWLKSETINIISEIEVLDAALYWTEQNIEDRLAILPKLLDCVRFPVLNHSQMQELFSKHVKSRKVVSAVRSYLRTCDILSNDIRSFPRKSSTRSIYVIGGFNRAKNGRWSDAISLKTVVKYDTFKRQWENVHSISCPRSKHAAVSLNRKIYVVGGEDDLLMYNNLEIYNLQTGIWTEGPAMSVPRSGFGLCACDGKIYAFGGWVGSVLGDNVEVYDQKIGHWVTDSVIPHPKFACGVVEMDGMIYIVGGTETESSTEMTTCDSFNPVTKEWTELQNMNVRRSDLALVALDGFIYAVGGYNEYDRELSTVERYSPEENTWTMISPMSERRTAPSAVGLNGLLYAIGGSKRMVDNPYTAPVTLESVECYDPLTDIWTELPPLHIGRSEAAAVVL